MAQSQTRQIRFKTTISQFEEVRTARVSADAFCMVSLTTGHRLVFGSISVQRVAAYIKWLGGPELLTCDKYSPDSMRRVLEDIQMLRIPLPFLYRFQDDRSYRLGQMYAETSLDSDRLQKIMNEGDQ